MSSFHDKRSRNPAEYPVLGILAAGPLHGYDLCQRLRDGIGSIWRLGKSQVYGLLVKLEREGLVIHERVGQENLPARNIFTLTQRGEEVFNQWLDHPVPHLRDMRLEFLAKVWFARQADPEGGRGLIEKQLVVCRERLNLLKDLQQSCRTQIEALSISFRLTMVEAAIAWLGDIKDATK